jgi:glutathione S-transferase
MRLYGTVTSPYVRRVRVIADIVGAEHQFVDVSTEQGEVDLRTVTPIWKIPVLDTGEKALFDSAVINAYLLKRYGNRFVRTQSGVGRWREQNLITCIDGATDAAINVFYLARDGVTSDTSAYLAKQQARVESAMNWIEKQLDGPWFTETSRLGRAEIALLTTLEWMEFRDTYDPARHPSLARFMEAHRGTEAFVRTRPPSG